MIMRVPTEQNSDISIACATCGEQVAVASGYCTCCLTPAELSRSVAERGTPARYVSVLGASGAGKTVYLGFLLDMLSKGVHDLRGLPNGPFSVAVQQQTMSALEQRKFPEKTSSDADRWRWVHCELSRRSRKRQTVDLITPDFAGEAIALEVEQPGFFQTIERVVSRSEALLLLLDAEQVRDASREQDFFAMKLASYLRTVHSKHRRLRRGRLTIPISIIFTKADTCLEAAREPETFAKSNLPGLVHACERTFSRSRFFAAGVVGSTATMTTDLGHVMRIPLHIEPHGVMEPLEWIMQQLK